MKKEIICIECPNGCKLIASVVGDAVTVTGNDCPKGEQYAVSEIQNPLRILTTSVLTKGLVLKLIPVRTSGPIPKKRLIEAMSEIKKIRLKEELRVNEIIVNDFLGLGVNLINTREAKK